MAHNIAYGRVHGMYKPILCAVLYIITRYGLQSAEITAITWNQLLIIVAMFHIVAFLHKCEFKGDLLCCNFAR